MFIFMGRATEYMLDGVLDMYFVDPETNVVYHFADETTDPRDVFTEAGIRASNITEGLEELLPIDVFHRLRQCDLPEDLGD